MGNAEFVYVSYIATTPEKLWAALTSGEFTRAYWYDRRIESTWQVGAPVLFYDGGSDTVTDRGEVLVYTPPTELVYTFRPDYGPEAGDEAEVMDLSRVRFNLEALVGKGNVSLVKLTLIHDELPDEETAAGYREGWAPILSSLKSYLETGTPLPQLQHFEEQGRPDAAQVK